MSLGHIKVQNYFNMTLPHPVQVNIIIQPYWASSPALTESAVWRRQKKRDILLWNPLVSHQQLPSAVSFFSSNLLPLNLCLVFHLLHHLWSRLDHLHPNTRLGKLYFSHFILSSQRKIQEFVTSQWRIKTYLSILHSSGLFCYLCIQSTMF